MSGLLGAEVGRAPPTVIGDRSLLSSPMEALLCSRTLPADLLLPALDVAIALRARGDGSGVAGGFQSPLERRVLGVLLRGQMRIAIFPARGLDGFRVPAEWRPAIRSGRMVVVSELPGGVHRPTARTAAARDRSLLAHASGLVVLSAPPGTRTFRSASEALDRGMPVRCLDHPVNADLVLLGARPFLAPPAAPVSPAAPASRST